MERKREEVSGVTAVHRSLRGLSNFLFLGLPLPLTLCSSVLTLLFLQAARINEELVRRHEQMMATEFNKQIKQFATGTAPPKPPTLVACECLCRPAIRQTSS